ncbi:uncharacterized protein [Drosophila tropicalis]|uniref:uncharacterized protein n=1 Tax=Drosophila tropicalis TaxID=46794 RepID=UPI0035ABD832
MWDYEPISIEPFTSDESLLKIDARIDRIKRGEFAISSTIVWDYDADESTMVEATGYHSSSGDEKDYKLLPWTIPKQPFFEYLNTYYQDVVLKNVGDCSNLPRFEGKFQPPWPRNTYVLDKCVSQGEGLPQVAPSGFYKIIFVTSGQVRWGFNIVVKVFAKSF